MRKSSIAKKVVAAAVLVVLMGAVAIAAFIAWDGYMNRREVPPRPVSVKIDEGMTATQIANILEDKKVIKNAIVFRFIVKKQGVGENFKPGEYELKTDMAYDEVIKILVEGPPIEYISLTLPEGWTAKQMSERVESLTGINKDDYLQAVKEGKLLVEYPFLKNSGAPTKDLEGYLYPETYKVERGITAEEFINIQLSQFQERTSNLNWSNAQARGRTPYEIVIIASMIERETIVNDERPIVAAVIYNRLAKGMPLQIDATVQYALPQWKDRLMFEDLKIESPYNTYKHKGLPPGPICSPSSSSIDAALNPTDDKYLYYVLAGDNSGRHVFSNTYNEHINAKNQYKANQR
ncbi:MAG: endolytic transglycosylase MltG [Actinobacteria bacterium]|nr:endolytic transglycosylase MltG [Actinomycetota bacterium]